MRNKRYFFLFPLFVPPDEISFLCLSSKYKLNSISKRASEVNEEVDKFAML